MEAGGGVGAGLSLNSEVDGQKVIVHGQPKL